MTLVQWIYDILGEAAGEFEFLILITACILLVISFTCALSLFIGIAFAIFRR